MDRVHELFPLVVYQGSVNGHEEFKQKNLDSLRAYWFNGYQNESPEYSGRIFVHRNPEYKNFFKELKNNIDSYMQHLNVDHTLLSYHVIKAWVGCHLSDDTPSIGAHYHNESNISFVYYLQTDETSDKLCIQQNKNLNEVAGGMFETAEQRNLTKGFNRYNCNFYTITPTEGTVVMFPSLTYHSIQKIATREKERIVIAGDIRITLSDKNPDYHQGSTHPSQWLEL
jgi:uncharacterized protein (TIGR02466 family)